MGALGCPTSAIDQCDLRDWGFDVSRCIMSSYVSGGRASTRAAILRDKRVPARDARLSTRTVITTTTEILHQPLLARSDEVPAVQRAHSKSALRSPSRCTRVPAKSLPFGGPVADQLRGRQDAAWAFRRSPCRSEGPSRTSSAVAKTLHARSREAAAVERTHRERAPRSPRRCTRVPAKSLPFGGPVADQLRGRQDAARAFRLGFPAMGTGFGGMNADEAARQMAAAYRHYLNPPSSFDCDMVAD